MNAPAKNDTANENANSLEDDKKAFLVGDMPDRVGDNISASTPDWSRESVQQWWDPSRQLLRSIRGYQKCKANPSVFNAIKAKLYVFKHRFWSVVCGSDIPINCTLGGGLRLQHPIGVVIHPCSSVGPNCLLLQQVTIVEGVTIGGHVDIGAGAKIVRPVMIGNHAKIGANAVVLEDVPAGATAVGVPAKIIARA